jgi:hypothetical protein
MGTTFLMKNNSFKRRIDSINQSLLRILQINSIHLNASLFNHFFAANPQRQMKRAF